VRAPLARLGPSTRTGTRLSIPVAVKALIVIAVTLTYWRGLITLCASVNYNDFGKFYYSVTSWRAGASLYALSPASYIGGLPYPLTNLNPPQTMLLVWPLSFLPIAWAFGVWMVANGLALIYVSVLIGRESGWRPGFWQLAVLLAGAPTATWLVTGQLTGLLAVPLALAWLRWRGGRAFAGGLWFGPVLSIKPFLGLFVLWLLWRRDWGALRGMALGATAAFGAGLAVFGLEAFKDWLGALAAVEWAWGAINASLLGVITRAFTKTPFHVPLAVKSAAVIPLQAAASIAVLAILFRRIRDASVDEAWSLLMAAALLVSPLGWAYYLWWLLPGLPVLLSGRLSFMLLLPIVVVGLLVFDSPSPLTSVVIGSAYCWPLLSAFLSMKGHAKPFPGYGRSAE